MGLLNPTPEGQEQQQQENPDAGGAPDGATERPEWLPEELWGDKGFNADAFEQFKTRPEAAADVPATADAYELPAIDGFDTEKAKQSGLFKALMKGAHANGLGQAAFEGVVTEYVQEETAAALASETAERAKLGGNAPARLKAVEAWISSSLAPAEAAAVMAGATSADAIIGLEKLMNARAGAKPRDPAPLPPAGKTEEEIRALMNTPAYSGKKTERDQAVVDEVTAWFAAKAAREAKK